ncbi:hypothetical protein LAZ67_14000230 [Cordylochernes scorpioides]|uniref:ribonuclease H n=1 Tax=Cordylochernes scorpioides TaxID=51811 RepID=A0ABY6L5H6_9ARAC|nr:hypothetical protein LAZ67_14000230 [Cordylochernes scorpioides]
MTQAGGGPPLELGAPQGSVLSPFLWNVIARHLFTHFLIRESLLVGYADDFTLLIQVRGRLPIRATNDFLNILASWCLDNGLHLNPSKTQACIFQWRRVRPNPDPVLKIEGQPINIGKSITILGVEFGQTRRFVAHLRNLTRRCKYIIPRLAYAIQGKYGLSFLAGRNIFSAVVIPAFLYGVSAWGSRASANEGIRQLRSLHYTFARCILRGGPCTPTIPAISITGSPPLDIIIRSRMAFLKQINEGGFEIKPGPAALPYPPFRRLLSFSLNFEEVTTPIIYTDGSKSDIGVGAAVVLPSPEQPPVLLRLHPNCTAFQAELLAILWAVRIAGNDSTGLGITIASDCQSALATICSSGPAQSALVAEIILALDSAPHINLCWVRGHSGIDGNERADRAARNAASSTLPSSYSILPRSHARNLSRASALAAWTDIYTQDHSTRFLRRITSTPCQLLKFLSKIRHGGITTTILTGHGHVLADFALWYPGTDPTCPHCLECPQTVDHLLFDCPAFLRHRTQTALLLGQADFDSSSLARLPETLPAWNFLVDWFSSATRTGRD